MLLSVRDRVIILNILPAQGSIATLRIIRQLQDDCGFSEEENEKFKFVQVEGRVGWDNDESKEIPIGPVAAGVIKTQLETLSENSALPIDYLDLYERFADAVGD